MARGKKSKRVRDVAEQFGVSERTVWRWLAKDPEADIDGVVEEMAERTCDHCGHPLPADANAKRRYCDDRCRQYARRATLAQQEFAALRAARTHRSSAN